VLFKPAPIFFPELNSERQGDDSVSFFAQFATNSEQTTGLERVRSELSLGQRKTPVECTRHLNVSGRLSEYAEWRIDAGIRNNRRNAKRRRRKISRRDAKVNTKTLLALKQLRVVSLAGLTPPELEREQARLTANPELFLRLAQAVAIPKGKSGKLIPNKALFGKLMKVAHRLDRNIKQGV
jgi:hypothetical protein